MATISLTSPIRLLSFASGTKPDLGGFQNLRGLYFAIFQSSQPKLSIVTTNRDVIQTAVHEQRGFEDLLSLLILEGLSVHTTRHSLEQLVSGITPENLHREIESGSAQGNEIW